MNTNALSKLLITIFVMLFGFVIMIKILTEGWNALANFYKYFLPAAAILSFVSPRAGLVMLVFFSAYMDLFKRFIILYGQVFQMDLIYIVALPPICAVAAFSGSAVKYLFGHSKSSLDVATFRAAVIGSAILVAAIIISSGTGLENMRTIAVAVGFVGLVFTVPMSFRTKEDYRSFLKLLVFVFIPVGIYAIWQKVHGLADYEIAYLRTGLSAEERILAGETFRVFSTMNSSQNLCKVMGLLAALTLIPFKLRLNGTKAYPWILRVILAAFFFYIAYISGARTGMAMGVITLLLYLLFQRPWLTLAAYGVGIAGIVLLIFSAEHIAENQLHYEWESQLYKVLPIERENRVLTLGTLTVRFESLAKIADGTRMYPFGAKAAGVSEEEANFQLHEIISGILVKVGWVPMLIGLIIVTFLLVRIHRGINRLPRGSLARQVAIFSLANFVAVFVGAISASANLQTFPITYFLYVFPGYAIMLVGVSMREAAKEKAANEEDVPVSEGPVIPARQPAWRPATGERGV